MIRAATPSDLNAIAQIEQATQSHGWTFQQLADELERPNGHLLVATTNSEVIGFAAGWSVAEETHILDVAVSASERRNGVGRALVEALLTLCGNPIAMLEVRDSNTPARALYESLGFKTVGRRERYYKDGEAAVLMTLESANAEVILLGER
ncbi:MAG: ribosomal protein S18-alanine N-acetyltransferase [Myxococcota bacterium]|nr:ribosomal protein S18-alanine N-acetyltransferase [Myxococcota bacterium]